MPSEIPPPPPGFSLDQQSDAIRGKRKGVQSAPSDGESTLHLPLATDIKVRRGDLPPVRGVVDGDTLSTQASGPNIRLWGADAPELKQPGYDRQGRAVPVGQQAKQSLSDFIYDNAATIGPVQGYSYGRPVAPVAVGNDDLANLAIRFGNALSAPDFLSDDPARRFAYVQAERLARQNALGPLNRNFVEKPADYRREVRSDPDYVVPRETVAEFWDTPTPFQGLPADVERELTRLSYDPNTPVQDVAAYAEAHGFKVDPAQVQKSRAFYLKTGKAGGLEYLAPPQVLTDVGDGAGGAAARHFGQGFLAGGLDEAGALADTLIPYVPGMGPPRENVWNSDRRFSDIVANNQQQNASILGYDEFAHPYASTGAEITGGLTSGLIIPYGQGARTIPELARVGGAYGGLSGFLGTDGSLPQRLEGAAIGVPVGMITGAGLGKAVEVGAPYLGRAVGKVLGKGAQDAVRGTTEAVGEYADDAAQNAAQSGARGNRPVDRLDIPAGKADTISASSEPVVTSYPGPANGRERQWIDIADIPPPPPGYTLLPTNDNGMAASSLREASLMARRPRSIGMDAEEAPSISGEVRQRDYIDTGAPPRPQPMDEPLSEVQRAALAQDIRPGDVLPLPSNEVGSAEEAAAKDAGRFTPAQAPNERGALDRGEVINFMGRKVPKVGPIDLVEFLRLRGGLKPDDQGELASLGIVNNAPRKGLDFVGQEARFGPMLSDTGMTLDDAALAAWQHGYFPESLDRPDVNTFLEALGETYNGGRGRRFLPEDQPRIEDFYARQADRFALEQRRAEVGGPVYEDRSVPADEPQPFPPAEAYDDRMADTAKRAGNINLDKLQTAQDIRRALVTTERTVGFDAATRGRVTQAETERLASDLNMTPEQLLARRKGQAFNAEQALAARQILAKSGNELVNLAKRVRSLEDPGDELLAQFRKAWLRHVAIQEQVSGATAEAGRALQQFRMAADSRAVRGEVLNALVRGGGGKDNLQDAAGALLDAVEAGPGVFNTVAQKASKPRFRDKIMEIYINSLLSGPQTHAVNTTSNTLTAMGAIPEYAMASALGGLRRGFSRGAIDRITGSEVGARAFGLLQGAREGARLFAQALRRGEASDFASKVEGEQYKAISGIKGEVVRIPTRLLTAEDEFFKGISRRMEMNGQAVRIAQREGLKGEAAKSRIAGLVANPTDEMLEAALREGRYRTFQGKLGPFAQKVSSLTQDSIVAKIFLPFVRTPTNLLKFTAERSPLAPLLKEWRAEFSAGGASRDLALAKLMVGTGFGYAIYEGALNGHISGSPPADDAKARSLYADGWQPYSIRLGDQWFSYKRLDPFAMTIGTAADLATLPEGLSEKQREDKAALVTASIMGNLANKTWLSGLADLTEALSDPGRYADNLERRLVASFVVPNLLTQTARVVDPVRRKRESVGDEIKSRVPGLSDDLLPQRDIWGAPIINGNAIGPDILSPMWVSEQLNDPVNRALLPLDYSPGYPSKTVGGRELSPEEYDHYSEAAGRLSHDRLTALVAGVGWKDLDPEQRVKLARRTVEQARDEVRAQIFGAAHGSGDAVHKGDAIPPPPSGFSVVGEAGGRNVYADLREFLPESSFTSGFRTPAYQADLKARGYHPASNSGHLSGSDFDLVPPQGKSMSWLKAQIKQYDPKARLLNEGDHLHVHFPGYYGAPALGGARGAGLHNPNAGMPPPPPGFKLEAIQLHSGRSQRPT